ncbi:MAG: MFS transporter [Bacteroidales bacterium]|nr:MFS transporter [Bacteroidales bacterium]MBN2698399.1 MFS transporter [Bacteroidales bacterium]
MNTKKIVRNLQYFKFSFYGFLKNLRFFDAFLILYLVEKGLSFTQVGILYAVREICINVFEVPSGIFADTFGRKLSLAGSFILYILSFIVFYLFADFWLFMIAFILFGIAEAFRSGTHKGMIMDYLKNRNWQDRMMNYYGHTRAWSQFGSALSAMIAGFIVFYSGSYDSIFLFSVVPYLLNFILILSYPQELDRERKQVRLTEQKGLGFTLKSFMMVVRKPEVLKIINSSAVFSAYLKAVKDYIQPLMVQVAFILPVMITMEEEKKNGVVIGLLYFLIYLLTSISSRNSARIAELNRRKIAYLTLIAGFLTGILCGAFYIGELWIFSLIAFAGIYVVENVRKPILTGYAAAEVPNTILTSVLSAQSLLSTLLTAVLAPVFGLIADHAGIGSSMITISGFLLISIIVIGNKKRGEKYASGN